MKNVGKAGRPVKLLANHFNLKLKSTTVARYAVEMTRIFGEGKSRVLRTKDADISIRAFEGEFSKPCKLSVRVANFIDALAITLLVREKIL